jgi:hypothetical protein
MLLESVQETRLCTRCKQSLSVAQFQPSQLRTTGKSVWCRECTNAYGREYYKRQRAEGKIRVRTHEHHRRKCLKKKYGITLEDYNRIFAEQGGVCAVCGEAESGNPYGVLEVEHDHETGRVRGLVCHPCNNAIMWYEQAHAYPHFERIVRYLK